MGKGPEGGRRGDESLLAEARRAAGLTQEELAERSGLSVRAIGSLERGAVERPRRRSLERLAEALGLSDDDREWLVGHYRHGTPATGMPRTTSPTASTGPSQLPHSTASFTGRTELLRQLDKHLDSGGDAPAIVVLSGLGGVGKTALALHWAHQRRVAFPDGQLFVNLHGYSPQTPLEPVDVLGRFLRSLGVPGERVPAELDERAALFRTMLADRQALVLLDNARMASQVRPLFPGAPRSMVVVTSRDKLRGLRAVDGAQNISVDALDNDEAMVLLAKLAGDDQVAAHPDAATSIVEHCGGLPLALTIAGTGVETADDLATAASRLIDQGTAGLEIDADHAASLTSVFAWSLDALRDDAALMFRMLGLHPGPHISDGAAQALLGSSAQSARDLLDSLTNVHLLDGPHSGRYEFHDLVRLHASRLAASNATTNDRDAASARLLDYYLHTAVAATALVAPVDQHLQFDLAPPSTPLVTFVDRNEAFGWLELERDNIVAAAADAVDHEFPYTQLLARVLHRYLIIAAHYDAALALHDTALTAARRRNDLAGQSYTHLDLGSAYDKTGRSVLAIEQQHEALSIARRIGDRAAEGHALKDLATTYGRRGSYDDSIEYAQRSIEVARERADPVAEGRALGLLATSFVFLGRYQEAVTQYTQCVELLAITGDDANYAGNLTNLGEAYQQLEQFDRAQQCFADALAKAEQIGSAEYQSHASLSLASLHRRLGEYEVARRRATDAVRLARGAGLPQLEASALNILGDAERLLDRPVDATACHRRALDLARSIEAPYLQAMALRGIAHTEGNTHTARELFAEALDILSRLGVPEADEVRAELAVLDDVD